MVGLLSLVVALVGWWNSKKGECPGQLYNFLPRFLGYSKSCFDFLLYQNESCWYIN